jgi:hypothetical protein
MITPFHKKGDLIMEKTALSNRYKFEFQDGSTCEMTLAFILLKRLSSKNKRAYEACQKVMVNGPKDEFDMLSVIYAGYLCANMDKENLLTEDEFIEKCGCDRFEIMNAYDAMTNPKNRKASAVRSN